MWQLRGQGGSSNDDEPAQDATQERPDSGAAAGGGSGGDGGASSLPEGDESGSAAAARTSSEEGKAAQKVISKCKGKQYRQQTFPALPASNERAQVRQKLVSDVLQLAKQAGVTVPEDDGEAATSASARLAPLLEAPAGKFSAGGVMADLVLELREEFGPLMVKEQKKKNEHGCRSIRRQVGHRHAGAK
jgi:hypothetical protein